MASAGCVNVVTECPAWARISLTALARSSSSSTTMILAVAFGWFVFGGGDAFLGRAGLSRGRKTVNVLPTPGSESTVIAP